MSTFHTNQIVSQKLARLGVKAESEKYWVHKMLLPDIWVIGKQGKERIPCFNLAELADVLREVGKNKEANWGFSQWQEVCDKFYLYGEPAANKYLESIL